MNMKAFSCVSADALILPVDLVDIMNAPKPRWGHQRGRSNLDGMIGLSRYAPPR
ncbi:hypothetical protein [Bradyrhizobium viridifuturi]|uniref:hypothetical protein n=1 Tax=Bradyrhizobium viridifuturi TaxID=1654716 RepID=UPI001AEC41BD|nr:hypothetical protein [Bradyrhizobium viridifuturi]